LRGQTDPVATAAAGAQDGGHAVWLFGRPVPSCLKDSGGFEKFFASAR
jgi:hypothetical protein